MYELKIISTMGRKESGGRASPVAQRLRQLRAALGEENAAAFARRLGITEARWHNFENGYPLSNEVAIRLVQSVPGLTLDWLYLGATAGLGLDMAVRLGGSRIPVGETHHAGRRALLRAIVAAPGTQEVLHKLPGQIQHP
jgi:hypothetical protein